MAQTIVIIKCMHNLRKRIKLKSESNLKSHYNYTSSQICKFRAIIHKTELRIQIEFLSLVCVLFFTSTTEHGELILKVIVGSIPYTNNAHNFSRRSNYCKLNMRLLFKVNNHNIKPDMLEIWK